MSETQEREVDWTYYPGAPIEMLQAEYEDSAGAYHHRLFVCAGTVPAEEDDEGDLIRVWIPEKAHPNKIPSFLEQQINEKHGKYAKRHEAHELDGYTKSIQYKNWS